jgi:hypothetical protein
MRCIAFALQTQAVMLACPPHHFAAPVLPILNHIFRLRRTLSLVGPSRLLSDFLITSAFGTNPTYWDGLTMKAKFAIVAFLVFGLVVLGYAYVRGYSPFTSQFVQTCEKAIKERLAVSSTYQRIGADESRRTMAWDEFFAEPERSVSVQVFGRRHDEPFRELWRPASKKRQGTKSREVWH